MANSTRFITIDTRQYTEAEGEIASNRARQQRDEQGAPVGTEDQRREVEKALVEPDEGVGRPHAERAAEHRCGDHRDKGELHVERGHGKAGVSERLHLRYMLALQLDETGQSRAHHERGDA